MIENIASDLRLYMHFLGMLIRSQAQYKINVAVDIGASFAITSLEFVALLMYFGKIPTMLGWSVGEVAMLYAVMSIGFGLAEMFGAGIDAFSDTIRLGEFDRISHELRNEITPSKQTIVGTKEYLSSVKAKKVKGREEHGEKKRSKLRGGVERGRNVPDKSIEHERG